MKLVKAGQAGTVESSDIMITIAPQDAGTGIRIELVSPVMRRYGGQIRRVINDMLVRYDIKDAVVHANDKGALDYTIRARMESAIKRALVGEGEP